MTIRALDLRKSGEHVFRDASGEIFLLRIGAQVREGKYGDRGFIGKCEGGFRRFFWGAGGSRDWTALRFTYCSDKAEALSRQCFDEPLFLATVTNCASSSIQAGRECCFGYDTALPDGVDQVVLADDMLPVADQVVQQVEDLWRDSNQFSAATQLAAVGVENVVLEEVAQAAVPPSSLRTSGLQYAGKAKIKLPVTKM